MKSIWTGSIAFGLVNIPVKLYSATEESSLDLDMLDAKDHSHIKFKRINEKTGKEVTWENIVKAYNLNNQYVILDDKDFEQASPRQTKEIAIEAFVNTASIDTIYYESPYFAEPGQNGGRAYNLLIEALRKTGKVAVGSFVLRNREHLCILRPYQNLLLVNRIRFAEEIRSPNDLELPENTKPKPAELKMAISLIEQQSDDFDITKWKDTYTQKLMQFIQAKAKGKKTVAPAMRVVHSTQTTDLLEQLKASLSKKKKKAS